MQRNMGHLWYNHCIFKLKKIVCFLFLLKKNLAKLSLLDLPNYQKGRKKKERERKIFSLVIKKMPKNKH